MTTNDYNIHYIQGSTGHVKSYAAMKQALIIAEIKKGRVIISVSSLALVDQMYKNLFELKETFIFEQQIELKTIYVDIEKYTSYETLQPCKILSLFENGGVIIIITVHQYLKEFDDYFTTSTFLLFISCFY